MKTDQIETDYISPKADTNQELSTELVTLLAETKPLTPEESEALRVAVVAATPNQEETRSKLGDAKPWDYKLFRHMEQEHGLVLTDSQLEDIIHEVVQLIGPVNTPAGGLLKKVLEFMHRADSDLNSDEAMDLRGEIFGLLNVRQ